jgi:hypothetical protein
LWGVCCVKKEEEEKGRWFGAEERSQEGMWQ